MGQISVLNFILMKCRYCSESCIKNGVQCNGNQIYKCKKCNRSQQQKYFYKACLIETDLKIYKLVINSCGVTDISRILEISSKICQPIHLESNQSYEIDELKAKCSVDTNCWVTYGINKYTRKVISFVVGGRSKEYLGIVTNEIIKLNPKQICTDKWISYKSLIPKDIHKTLRYKTNRIERHNLNLRTHLKRFATLNQ